MQFIKSAFATILLTGLMGSALATHEKGKHCKPSDIGNLACNERNTGIVSPVTPLLYISAVRILRWSFPLTLQIECDRTKHKGLPK